jgi:hypothetical protein
MEVMPEELEYANVDEFGRLRMWSCEESDETKTRFQNKSKKYLEQLRKCRFLTNSHEHGGDICL